VELLNFAGWKATNEELAVSFLEKAKIIRENALKAAPEDWRAQLALSTACEQLAVKYIKIESDVSVHARVLLEKSRKIAQDAAERDSANLFTKMNLATSKANHAYTLAEDARKENNNDKAGKIFGKALELYASVDQSLKEVQSAEKSLNASARAAKFEGIVQYQIAELLKLKCATGTAILSAKPNLPKLIETLEAVRGCYDKAVERRFEYLKNDSGSWYEHDSFAQQVKLCWKSLMDLQLRTSAASLLEISLQKVHAVQSGVAIDSPSFNNWLYTESVLHSIIAENMLAGDKAAGAVASTKSALDIQVKLLRSPEIAPFILKTVPETLTKFFKKASVVPKTADTQELVDTLFAGLTTAMSLDVKTFPRSEWALAFALAREKLASGPAATKAARAAAQLYPDDKMPLPNAEQILKQRLLGQLSREASFECLTNTSREHLSFPWQSALRGVNGSPGI
jgi:tetratricopeptide (TPR) repeat protein